MHLVMPDASYDATYIGCALNHKNTSKITKIRALYNHFSSNARINVNTVCRYTAMRHVNYCIFVMLGMILCFTFTFGLLLLFWPILVVLGCFGLLWPFLAVLVIIGYFGCFGLLWPFLAILAVLDFFGCFFFGCFGLI